MLIPACGFAQARPPEKAPAAANARYPIETIAVEGNRSYSKDQVVQISGLKIGQLAGRTEFDAARDRLAACGAFETVSYRFTPAGKGYAAILTVTEIEQVYPVDFEDLHVSTLDLTATLKAKDPLFANGKLPATQPVIDRYTKWVQEYLAGKGVDEKIAGAVRPGLPGEYEIVFHPARNLPAVAQITFEGNQVIPQNVLREAVAPTGIGLPYTEDAFRQMLGLSIRPLYESRGRVRVAFPTIRTEPVKDVEGLHVFVTVDEGQSYELGKVSIEGPAPLPADSLLKAGDFKAGDVANADKLNTGIEAIRKEIRHAGYMNAQVDSERHINDVKKTVDVVLRISAGPQFTMGKLTIAGLDLNAEAEMRRIFGMKEGKPYNPDYPNLFLQRVKEEAMFDNLGQTKADVHLNDRDHTADVTLSFKGADPQSRPGRRGGRGGRGPGLVSGTN